MSSTCVGSCVGGNSGYNGNDGRESGRGGGGGVGGGGGGGAEGGGRRGPCGACKFLRCKCVKECIFAPYFDSEEGVTNFAAVHKVFGASNASKMLHDIPPVMRLEAVLSICYEAQARLNYPVYGCTNEILALEEEVMTLRSELINMQSLLDNMTPPIQSALVAQPQTLVIDDFPLYNLPSSWNIRQTEIQWALQQEEHQQQFVHGGGNGITNESDLQALAWELLNENMAANGPTPPQAQQ